MSSNTKNEDVKTSGNDNNDKKKYFGKKQGAPNRSTKFEGRCDELKGYVYDYGESKNANQYVQTTKEISTYVGRTFKHDSDIIQTAIEDLAMPIGEGPKDPSDPDNRIAVKKWEKAFDKFCKWEQVLKDNMTTLYNIVWGQCSESMQQKLERLPTYKDMSTTKNAIDLLTTIKDTTYDYQSQKFGVVSVVNAENQLSGFRQGPHMSADTYFREFSNRLSVYLHCGGSNEPGSECIKGVCKMKGYHEDDVDDDVKEEAWELKMGIMFLLHADPGRYSGLTSDLQNNFLYGTNHYPSTINEALGMLTYYDDSDASKKGTNGNSSTNGASFTNVGTDTDNKKKIKDNGHITCFNCQQKGHYANKCTNEKVERPAPGTGTTHAITNESPAIDTATTGGSGKPNVGNVVLTCFECTRDRKSVV